MARIKRLWFGALFFFFTGFTERRLRELFSDLVELDLEDFKVLLIGQEVFRVQAFGATVHIERADGPAFTLNENTKGELYVHEWFPERQVKLDLGPTVTYNAGFYEVYRSTKPVVSSLRWARPLRRVRAAYHRGEL